MKTINKNFLMAIFICCFGSLLMSSCNHTQNEDKPQIHNKVTGISIDSLKKLGTNLTLWAESKQDFEKMNNVKLEQVSSREEWFVSDISQSSGEICWTAYKNWMVWQQNDILVFIQSDINSTAQFVGIGDYFADNEHLLLKFHGTIYRYHIPLPLCAKK